MQVDAWQVEEVAARCSGIVKIYSTATGEVHALKGIDATFPYGAVTAIVGPSGSGKSSLLRILAGMDEPTAGSVTVSGSDITDLSARALRALRRKHIGYVYQRPSDNLISYLTVWEHMKLSVRLRGHRRVNDAYEILEALGIYERIDHKPHQMSGGEQQRLAFAQALMGEPKMIVADEPTAELDSASSSALLGEISNLAQRGIAFILSTHDQQVVQSADRSLHLRHGNLEVETDEGVTLAVIDSSGRVQLPQDALKMFPRRRAVIHVEGDEVRITPP